MLEEIVYADRKIATEQHSESSLSLTCPSLDHENEGFAVSQQSQEKAKRVGPSRTGTICAANSSHHHRGCQFTRNNLSTGITAMA